MRTKYKITLGILLLSLMGCSPVNDGFHASTNPVGSSSPSSDSVTAPSPTPTAAAQAPAQSPTPEKFRVFPPSASPQSPTISPTAPASSTEPKPSPDTAADQPASETGNLAVKRDYDFETPIPSTGKLTTRENIRNVDVSKIQIANCPADSGPYALAESMHYRIQVCSKEYDPWMPKYYVGQAKDGSGELHITATNPEQARQLIFKNGDYTYVIYRGSARPEKTNAYLEVHTPNGRTYAEALLYLYERTDRPKS